MPSFIELIWDAGQTVIHSPQDGRYQFLYVIDGSASVNGQMLNRREQARITGELSLSIKAETRTDLILVDNH
jgi:redox-sensitive bicupin YhaK (pirin superfamily)